MSDSVPATNDGVILLPSQLRLILGGVETAIKAPAEIIDGVKKWFQEIEAAKAPENVSSEAVGGRKPFAYSHWECLLASSAEDLSDIGSTIASLVISITALRQSSRQGIAIDAQMLSRIWQSVSQTLKNVQLQQNWVPSRSAQGFLSVPLCSITKNGMIDELIRFHVWLPDGKRGVTDLAVHSHQPFAQSWILAGEGIDHQYEVKRVTEVADATHEEFGLSWNTGDGSGPSKQYSAHQHSSVVAATGRLVHTKLVESTTHRRNDSYTIPSGEFHSSQVAPDALHATLFYFDASQGFIRDAPVLGPVRGKSHAQVRDSAGVTLQSLERYVSLVRTWEEMIEVGKEAARSAEWEQALQAFNSALGLYEGNSDFPASKRYKGLVLGEIGSTNRRFGRYDVAKDFLVKACLELENCPEQATFSGELGVVYRHSGQLEHAKKAFEAQYEASKSAELDFEACRAIGNLGMVNYQLSEQLKDSGLLMLAIHQQRERVERCENLKTRLEAETGLANSASSKLRQLEVWMTIGLTRLAICLDTQGNIAEAFRATEDAVKHAKRTGDPTVVAISRFFYGRAFDTKGDKVEGLRQFNTLDGCTCAIAFCKEPSEEHHAYLEYLVNAGADMNLVDDQGYKALDYAIFNGDETSCDLVVKGLRQQMSGSDDMEAVISQQVAEARLRKGYREFFQEKLRPVLIGGGEDCMERLRTVYAEELSADPAKEEMFDHFKVVPYVDLLRHGKFPRSSDGLARRFDSINTRDGQQFIIFVSYRWLNPMIGPGGGTADDDHNTQYKRLTKAMEDFLALRPKLEPKNLQIWMVRHLNSFATLTC